MANVLIIDDNVDMCRTLTRRLDREGKYSVVSSHTLGDGLKKAKAGDFDVIFLDVMMPDGNGLDILPDLRHAASSPEVIIITGKGESKGAAIALEAGAWDYVPKGSSLDMLILPLERALQYRLERLRASATRSLIRDKIIGVSRMINACLDIVAKAAATDTNVLIVGETGVGKELFARAIHENSRRNNNDMVVVDCAGVPETLIESTLFGHERGAFTGAEKARIGLIKEADGGTLFLDEVGELTPSFQKTFLRVLQEKTFRPVGGEKEIRSDFRVVAASNKSLDALVKNGTFREDLLFRLNTIVLKIPPLREHPEDIKPIAAHQVAQICDKLGIATKGISLEFMEALIAYSWPGNIRELIHTLERAITMAGIEAILFPQFLPSQIRLKLVEKMLAASTATADNPTAALSSSNLPNFKKFREAEHNQIERQYLIRLLGAVDYNLITACEISGLSRSQLYKLLKKHGISFKE